MAKKDSNKAPVDDGLAKEVAALRAAGKTIKQIARELHVSDHRVSAMLKAARPAKEAKGGKAGKAGKGCGKACRKVRVTVHLEGDPLVLTVESDSLAEAFDVAWEEASARAEALPAKEAELRDAVSRLAALLRS